MDLQLTTAEAHIVRDALDEFVTLRVDALKRADGSPGHPQFPAVAANAMRTAGRTADRVLSRLAHKIELADGLAKITDDHGDIVRWPVNDLTVAVGSDLNIYIEDHTGRRLIVTDTQRLTQALDSARSTVIHES